MDKVRTNNSTRINTEKKETYRITGKNMMLSDTRRLKKIRSRRQQIEKRILQEDREDSRLLNHQYVYNLHDTGGRLCWHSLNYRHVLNLNKWFTLVCVHQAVLTCQGFIRWQTTLLTFPFSITFVSMAITCTRSCQIILQKSTTVSRLGPCVAM